MWIGLPYPADEVPERAEAIRAAAAAAGSPVVEAQPHADDALLAVHDAELVDFLRGGLGAVGRGRATRTTRDRTTSSAYIFPHPGLVGPHEPLVATSPSARAGNFAFDTMTPVGAGTWEAARGAVDCALTACDLVLAGAPLAYACTRPPGHHVTRTAYGGSCYLNNAAVSRPVPARPRGDPCRDRGRRRAPRQRRAVDLLGARRRASRAPCTSIPAAGWFPHYLGLAGERGGGAGEGANLNLTLPPGTADDGWLDAIGACDRGRA